ncbi:hypothetical protein Tco_0904572 [Tanacetum coccineum]
MDRNRLMRTDELHKFSDGTLNHVRTILNDIATRIQMEYLLKRKWSKQDKQRARVMIKAIDKKLKDKRKLKYGGEDAQDHTLTYKLKIKEQPRSQSH